MEHGLEYYKECAVVKRQCAPSMGNTHLALGLDLCAMVHFARDSSQQSLLAPTCELTFVYLNDEALQSKIKC